MTGKITAMKKRHVFFIFLLAWIALVLSLNDVAARIWHVDNSSTNGSAGGYYDPADRMQTIAEAVASMAPGDDLWIWNSGTDYTETIGVTNSGTSWANPIEIVGINSPTITGGISPAAWTNAGGSIWYTACPTATYMVVENGAPLEMVAEEYWRSTATSAHSNMWTYLAQGWTNDNLAGTTHDSSQWNIMVADFTAKDITAGTNNITRSGTWAWSASNLFVRCSDDGDPNSKTMEVANRPALCVIKGDYVVVRGINFRLDNQAWINNWSGIRLDPQTQAGGIRFQGNTVSNSSFIGVTASNFSTPGRLYFQGNTIYGAGCLGVGGNSIGGVFEGNSYIGNNFHRFQDTWQSAGLKLTTPVMDVSFFNETAAGNYGSGLWVDIPPVDNIRFDSCTSSNNYRHGIYVEYSNEVAIINCVLRNNYRDGVGTAGTRNSIIAHNVLFRNGSYGAKFAGTDRLVTQEAAAPSIFAFARGDEANSSMDWPTTDNVIYNNIFVSNHYSGNQLTNWTAAAYRRGELQLPSTNNAAWNGARCVSDYNVFWPTNAFYASYDGANGEEFSGVTAWTNEGWDTSGAFLDPSFTDPDTGDFTVATDSPAVDLAKHIAEAEYDRAGERRWTDATLTNRTAGAYRDPRM